MRAPIFAIMVILFMVGLGACQSPPRDTRPCGVIRDSLSTVAATTAAAQQRLDIHFARGRAAGCW